MYHGIGIGTSNSNIHGEFSMCSGQQRLSVTVRITILLIRQKSLWNQRHAVGRYCRPSENVSRRFSWNYFAAITAVANKTDPPHTYSQTYAGTFLFTTRRQSRDVQSSAKCVAHTYGPTTNVNHGVQDTYVRNKTLPGLGISKSESAKEPLWPMPHVKDHKSVHLDVAVFRSQLFSFTGINRHRFTIFRRFHRRRGDMTPYSIVNRQHSSTIIAFRGPISNLSLLIPNLLVTEELLENVERWPMAILCMSVLLSLVQNITYHFCL